MIRIFKQEDAKICSKIMIKCIHKNLTSLSKENKEFMIKMSQPDKLIEKSQKVLFYVYEIENKILGTGALDRDEIRTMFVDPIYQKKGIGKEMLNFLINLAKSKGYKRIWLGASIEAEGFYKKQGFKKFNEKNDFNFKVIEMEKILN
ncbi:MAG: GNAT family N-acetyltransferase [Candidatus Pacearchaeota archaeon]